MNKDTHYFMSVPKDDFKQISDTISKLNGFMVGYINANVDPEHGPVNEVADMFNQCRKGLKRLDHSLSGQFHQIKDLNKEITETKQEMVDEIMAALTSDATGLDLIVKLKSALDNYAIIGRKPKPTVFDDKDIPF